MPQTFTNDNMGIYKEKSSLCRRCSNFWPCAFKQVTTH